MKKLNDILYFAKEAHYDAIRTGLQPFRDKAEKYYREYKEKGGKRIVKELEGYLK